MSLPRGPQLAGPTEVPGNRARLLLLSYHFPPGEAAGALRWQMLAGLAAERGLGLDVLTVHPASLPAADERRLARLPADTRVFGIALPALLGERAEHAVWRAWRALRPPAPTPAETGAAPAAPSPMASRPGSCRRAEVRFRPWSARAWLRAWYAWRETRCDLAWALAATRLGARLAQPGVHRAVVCCGPPHMPFEAARRLARRTGLPLVLDMRDPWRLQQRLNEHVASPLWFRLAERYERRCVRQAALVVTNTEPFRDRMRLTYPEQAERIIAVMNGFDEEPLPEVPPDPRFVVAYAGAIYLDRDPGPLLHAGARVIREEGLSPEQFRFEFIGNTDSYGGVPVRQIAAAAGIADYVGTGPQRPRAEAMAFLARATLLVSLPQDSDLAIPSKVFEYLNFKAWVLALATPESATGRALAGTGADLADPGDEVAIAEVLRRRWRAFTAGSRPERPAGTERLSRRAQARLLFDALIPLLNRA